MPESKVGGTAGVMLRVSAVVPQELAAVQITVPTPVPTVAVKELVVLLPDQPIPATVQDQPVAPVEVALHDADGEPTQAAVMVVTTGVVGSKVGVMLKVSAVLVPQVLFAITVTVATPVPTVRLMESVVLVPDHPVPVTVHV